MDTGCSLEGDRAVGGWSWPLTLL